MNTWTLILSTVYLILPGVIANMIPVMVRKVPVLNYPLDFGLKFRGEALLGKNKTFRGLVFGVVMSILVVYGQKLLYPVAKNISLIDYSKVSFLWLGFLMGFGVILGDAVESFVKRRKALCSRASLIDLANRDAISRRIVAIPVKDGANDKEMVFLRGVHVTNDVDVRRHPFYDRPCKESYEITSVQRAWCGHQRVRDACVAVGEGCQNIGD